MSDELKLMSKLSCDLSSDYEVVEIHPRSFQLFGEGTNGDIEYNRHTKKLMVSIWNMDEDIAQDEIADGEFSLNEDNIEGILTFVRKWM